MAAVACSRHPLVHACAYPLACGRGGLQSVIVSSVHSLYGDVGLPGEVDVLQVLKDKTAVLRVPFDKQVRVCWFTADSVVGKRNDIPLHSPFS